MDKEIDNGGPAFPLPVEDDRDCAFRYASGYGGMTLRDWFAGRAMSAQVQASVSVEFNTDDDTDRDFHLWPHGRLFREEERYEIAELSYQLADAMIEARKAVRHE
jgi:hypothetical protein